MRVKGASGEEILRGLLAAEAVLERAGITASRQAAEGMFALEGWDISGFPDDGQPTEKEDKAAQIWMEAQLAALEACCAGWSAEKRPAAADLELPTDPEAQLADRAIALAKLRALTEAEDGNGEFMDSAAGTLAWSVAAALDEFLARDLVSDVTVAFTTLALAGFHPDEPIEPKRKAVLDAIEALEKAIEKPTAQ
ncbi:hypothetical protein [Mesorhizobium sp. M0040]|uniref:hypothetical protein n=1 Tax=Mesorhizobium sp. M0040 TaxID=2956855 RepID=UPI00333D681B